MSKIYIDLRLIGSSQSVYGDIELPLAERATRLLIDVLSSVVDGLRPAALQALNNGAPGSEITLRLSDMSESLSDIRVIGDVERTQRVQAASSNADNQNLDIKIGKQTQLGVSAGEAKTSNVTNERTSKNAGPERHYVSFGRVQNALSGLIDILGLAEVHVIIDEWSEVPIDLQPLLADLIRRTLLTNKKVHVKIAAIEYRTSFVTRYETGQYVGFELGADIPTGLNLDDFLVFDNDQDRALGFFRSLLFKHLKIVDPNNGISTPEELQKAIFTEKRAFEEFVRAVEGVPRDALNLIAILAEKRYGKSFGVPDVRAAAREWYHRDKFAQIDQNHVLSDFLTRIIQDVIRGRRARAFLVKSSSRDKRIETLFDLRILHLLKRNVSSNDQPGVRFDVYKFDYGCYVDLITTHQSPSGLFQRGDGGWVEVPADDYRSIRRAILDTSTI